MDDSTLKVLSVSSSNQSKHIALIPPFARQVKDYKTSVESKVKNINIKAVCNQSDGFASVENNTSDGVILGYGSTDVTIKVEASDRSFSIYTITVFRPTETGLEQIISDSELQPVFSKTETEYSIQVPLNQKEFKMELIPLNSNAKVTRLDENGSTLNMGETLVEYRVLAEDGKSYSDYKFTIRKEKQFLKPLFATLPTSLTCAICQNVCFQPRKKTNCEHIFCLSCIELTIFPVSGSYGESNWPCPLCDSFVPGVSPQKGSDSIKEKEIEKILVACVSKIYGCSFTGPFEEYDSHYSKCEFRLTKCDVCKEMISKDTKDKHQGKCTSTCTTCGKVVAVSDKVHATLCGSVKLEPGTLNPVSQIETSFLDSKVQIKSIEKTLEDCFSLVEQYTQSLVSSWKTSSETKGRQVQMPATELLEKALSLLANTIKKEQSKPQLEKLHFMMGNLLQELQLARQWFPDIKKEPVVKDENQEANDSFIADEVTGLLLSLGVPTNANEATKIKAMEAEYHRLKNLGSTNEAAEVQGLIAWKLKSVVTTTGPGATEMTMGNSSEYLSVSVLKYLDAIALNASDPDAYVALAELYLELSKPEESMRYITMAIALQPLSPKPKWLYALGILDSSVLPKQPVTSILESILVLENYFEICRDAMNGPKVMMIDDLFTPRGSFWQLAALSLVNGYRAIGEYQKAKHACEYILYVLPTIILYSPRDSTPTKRLWSLFYTTQCELLYASSQLNLKETKDVAYTISKLLSKKELNIDPKVALKMAQSLVFYEATAEYSEQLGSTLLEMYNQKSEMNYLISAFQVLQVAIDLESSIASLEVLKQQEWFLEYLSTQKEELKRLDAIKQLHTAASTKACKVPAAKDTPKTSKAAKLPVKPSPQKSSVEAQKPLKPAEKEVKAVPVKPTAKPVAKAVPKATTAKTKTESTKTITPKPAAASNTSNDKPITAPLVEPTQPPTPKRFKCRYLLAQVLLIFHPLLKSNTLSFDLQMDLTTFESKITLLLNEAIQINPTEHDSYIDLGSFVESLGKQVEAVDVYTRYPFNDPPTQDDLYLHTEIARILSKHKQWKRIDLIKSLIALGRATGIKSISHYIDQLDSAGESKALMDIYATVNKKPINDVLIINIA